MRRNGMYLSDQVIERALKLVGEQDKEMDVKHTASKSTELEELPYKYTT